MLPKSFLDPQISATIILVHIWTASIPGRPPLKEPGSQMFSAWAAPATCSCPVPSGHGERLKDGLDTSHKITWKFGKTMENQAWPSYPFFPPDLKVTETLETLEPTPTAATGTGLALRALHKVREAMYQALKRMKPCRSRDGREGMGWWASFNLNFLKEVLHWIAAQIPSCAAVKTYKDLVARPVW